MDVANLSLILRQQIHVEVQDSLGYTSTEKNDGGGALDKTRSRAPPTVSCSGTGAKSMTALRTASAVFTFVVLVITEA